MHFKILLRLSVFTICKKNCAKFSWNCEECQKFKPEIFKLTKNLLSKAKKLQNTISQSQIPSWTTVGLLLIRTTDYCIFNIISIRSLQNLCPRIFLRYCFWSTYSKFQNCTIRQDNYLKPFRFYPLYNWFIRWMNRV